MKQKNHSQKSKGLIVLTNGSTFPVSWVMNMGTKVITEDYRKNVSWQIYKETKVSTSNSSEDPKSD